MIPKSDLAWRRSRIAERLAFYFSADNLELALSVYDDGFVSASTFRPSEFIQCLTLLLPDGRLSEQEYASLSEELSKFQNLPDAEAMKSDDTQGRTPTQRPTEMIQLTEDVDPGSASTSRPHPHRPHSTRDPRKPTLLMGTYKREGEPHPRPIVVEDLSQSGVGILLFKPDDLQPSDRLQLQFELDDPHQGWIQVSVQVRWVRDDILGAAFMKPDTLPQSLLDYIQS